MKQLFVVCRCHHCGMAGQYPIQQLGKRTKCTHCQSSLSIQDADRLGGGEADRMIWWLEFTESGARKSPAFEMPDKTLPR
ncbi:MAG: hypothetical protein AAGA30_17275 [Planctomycetota bacterium]